MWYESGSRFSRHLPGEEKPMPTPTRIFARGLLASGAYLLGIIGFSALAEAAPPDFAPTADIGWYAYNRLFIAPASGTGPVMQDPSRPYVSNDEFRVTGRQPTERIADLNSPILQPWAREVLRKRNEAVLSGKTPMTPTAS
jgi:hypothetical protein